MKSSVVRELRKLTGLNQTKFAEMLGVSRSTVQSVELGRLPLSAELARRIADATGCGLETSDHSSERGGICIRPPKEIRLTQRQTNEPFTRDWFFRWRRVVARNSDLIDFKNGVCDLVDYALRAAIEIDLDPREPRTGHLERFCEDLVEALGELIVRQELRKDVCRLLSLDDSYLAGGENPELGSVLKNLRRSLNPTAIERD